MKKRTKSLKSYLQLILLFSGVVMAAAIIIYISYATLNESYETAREKPASVSYSIIDPSLVCMVNNTFMGSPQIPVEIGDKVYYGCCEGCVTTLNTNPESRFSTDPVNHAIVDKARAVITLDPHNKGYVLYFKNLDNLKNYFSVKP